MSQELKRADPEGFARLWQRGHIVQHDSRPAPAYLLALEYVLVAVLTALLAATTAAAFYHQVRPSVVGRASPFSSLSVALESGALECGHCTAGGGSPAALHPTARLDLLVSRGN